jgi:hypothetical protein
MKESVLLALLFASAPLWAQRADFSTTNLHHADSVALANSDLDLSNLPALAFKLTASLSTEVEKFRSIYTWVCTNVENDYGYYIKNRKNREKLHNDPIALANWNNNFRSLVFSKLLKEQKTICTGYAYLISELSGFAGITCNIIDGYGRTINANVNGEGIPNHSWNAVQLNNEWYLCDATWSSGSINPTEGKFIRDYNEGYFLPTPQLFIKSHYPLDTAWILTDTKPALKEFLEGPLVYKHTFSHQILLVTPKTLSMKIAKKETFVITLQASNKTNEDEFTLQLNRGSSSRIVKPDVKETGKGLYELSYTFDNLGKYDVHLMLEGDYIATYTVNVTNRN